MRPSIQGALCLVIDGTPSPDDKTCQNGHYDDPTVIITHSLGGYMLMDAIDDELRREDCGAQANTPAHKILAKTQLIYMMANQLALLDLTTLRGYPHRAGSAPSSNNTAAHFAQCWNQIALTSPVSSPPTESGEASAARRQVVAFSDPNDILSWRIQPKDLKLPRHEWGSVELTNVYMSNNEFSIPLLLSDPTTAHTGYFDNRTVTDLLVCGMEKGAVKPCPAKATP
jgi:hypothetical protein